jgi:DNA-binding HxlR family transcriptional regulator
MSKNKSLPYLDPELCGLAEGAKILGDRWVLLILREAFYGVTRFETMLAHTHITRQTLTTRLKTMTEMGLLRKVPYREAGSRERYEYVLTEKAVAWRWCCSP